MLVLGVEQSTQPVEGGFALLGQRRIDRGRVARKHIGDDGFGVAGPPRSGSLFYRVEILQQIGSVLLKLTNRRGSLLLDLTSLVIGQEKLAVRGDQIAADRGLLVPQRGLQLIRRDPRRLDVLDELAGHLVGSVQQHRHRDPTDEDGDTHDGQHDILPTLHRQPGRHVAAPLPFGHRFPVRSTRTTAMSSLIPPCDAARSSTASMRASTNAGPGSAASDRASSSRPCSPRRSLPRPTWPSNRPSVSNTSPLPSGSSTGCGSQSRPCNPSAGPRGFHPVHRPTTVQQHPGMPGPDRGDQRPFRGDREAEHRREDAPARPFGTQHPFELVHPFRSPQPGEGQSAPRDAQRHTERRLVRTVSRHIADHHVYGSVRRLHEVVEVAAEQGVLAAGAVLGDDLDARIVEQQRRREQTPLQSRVLPRPKLTRLQIDRGQFGTFTLDRIEHRPAQHLGIHPVLDEIVLSTGRHRRHPDVFVVETRQHHDRDGPVVAGDPVDTVDAVSVVQVQVQQDAVRTRNRDLMFGLGHRFGPEHLDVETRVRDHLFHQDRVGAIVLHQEQRQRVAVTRGKHVTRHPRWQARNAHADLFD